MGSGKDVAESPVAAESELSDPRAARPWPALWSLVIGFFMIMVDSTIVTIALPTIMSSLDTDLTGAMWVTSAYLLAYVVPLLITGRLGDRFGPKNLYLIGLVVFTTASVACGLSTTLPMLIAARVVQGLGAACISPQTMTTITRMFPGRSRGPAMSVWGATAGVATLVGPILGGVLTDSWGWEWIFFVNVPIGIVGIALAARFVPRLPLRSHSMDWVGAALSSVAMFAIVFGIQEGERYEWGTIVDHFQWGDWILPFGLSVWGLVGTGLLLAAGFVVWELRTSREPLIPMSLFRDRNFTLASFAVGAQACAMTTGMLPVILYLQTAREQGPTIAALVMAPMAVMSVVMARPVGLLVQRVEPKWIAVTGLALSIVGAGWMMAVLHADTPFVWLMAASAVSGTGSAMVWSPLSLLATYRLPVDRTGAGSGVYNALRQVGAVLGSAAITAVMTARIAAQFGGRGDSSAVLNTHQLADELREPFSLAMAQSMLLPMAATAAALVLSLFFAKLPPATDRERSRAVEHHS